MQKKINFIQGFKMKNIGRRLFLSNIMFYILFFFIMVSYTQTRTNPGNVKIFKIGADERKAILDTIIKKFNEFYVFPKIAKRYEIHLRNRLKDKAYDNITNLSDFTDQVTKDMLSVYPDGHLAILVYNKNRDLGQKVDAEDKWWENYVKKAKYENFGFNKIERLPGNIGYLELKYLERPKLVYETSVAAMKFLSNTDAIIIDLRKNPGGRSSQLLISYFFEDHRVHYSTEIDRLKGKKRQWWTLASVPGKRMPKIPLFILTSYETGSAAEEMAYVLKHTGRATLIGEKTAGAAHKTHTHSFPELNIVLAIPDGTIICPITNKDWEGTGVIPHIKVNPKKALDVAYSMALDHLLKNKKDEYVQFRLKWIKQGIDAKNNPIKLTKKAMKQYIGQYRVRKIYLKKGVLYYKREGRSEYKMIPMGADFFMLEGLDYFRIQFTKDKKGTVTKLIGLYDDGTSSVSERTGDS